MSIGSWHAYRVDALRERGTIASATVVHSGRRTMLVETGKHRSIPVRRPMFGFYRPGQKIRILFEPGRDYEASGFPFEWALPAKARVAQPFHLWLPAAAPIAAGAVMLLLGRGGRLRVRVRSGR